MRPQTGCQPSPPVFSTMIRYRPSRDNPAWLIPPQNDRLCAGTAIGNPRAIPPLTAATRVQNDAAHLGIDAAIGASACMNIRYCPVSAMPAHAALGALGCPDGGAGC